MDHEFHEDYPDPSHSFVPLDLDVSCRFILGDAMAALADRDFLNQYQVIAASPPCYAYSTITPDRSLYPRLIAPVREALRAWGGVYVIENVEGAAADMPGAVKLCGSSFGLKARRHRLFESNLPLTGPPCDHERQGTPVGVYGGHVDPNTYARPNGKSRGYRATTTREAREALGISWLSWSDLTDAIPPAYTEHLGSQLRKAFP